MSNGKATAKSGSGQKKIAYTGYSTYKSPKPKKNELTLKSKKLTYLEVPK